MLPLKHLEKTMHETFMNTSVNQKSVAAGQSASRSTGRNKRCQKIVEAAADLFLEQGFGNTSMDQIAERAGVSKQTVYSNFGSKEKVFVASIERLCVANSLYPGFDQQGMSVQQVLVKLAQDFTSMLLGDGATKVMRLCMSSAGTYPEISRLFYETGPENLQQLVAAYFDRLVADDVLGIPDTLFAAQQFLFMLNGEAIFRNQLGLAHGWSNEKLDAYLNSCVALFLRGYAKL